MTLRPGCAEKVWRMASSADMVLPLPVGAPSSTFSSEWYRVWNIWKESNKNVSINGQKGLQDAKSLETCRENGLTLVARVESCTWVCIALKCVKRYMDSYGALSRAETGRGSRSRSSVCGAPRPGNCRPLNDRARSASELCQLSDTALRHLKDK